MVKNDRFAVVIPVYNHGATVAEVVRASLKLGFPVIVVDDGSSDGGCRSLDLLTGVRLLRHRVNRGKGAALVTGMRAAAENAHWAITLDADGQHHPADALNLVAAIGAESRPIVIGHRQGMLETGAPWTSRFGREFSNFWIRRSGGPKLRDSQSGFRIYPIPEILHLGVRAGKYQYELEVLVKAHRSGIRVVEAPIRVSYPPQDERISHFHPFFDFLRNSGTFTRLIFIRIMEALPGLKVVGR
jgi:glycosyltransferase involved in cell wall biosynthesis